MTQYPLGYEYPQVLTDKAYWVMARERQTTQLSGHDSGAAENDTRRHVWYN